MVSAQHLARRYDNYAAIVHDHYGTRHWRGELATVRTFMAWIESCWWEEGPPEPSVLPDAVSSVGESAVRWYDAGSTVLGYQTGLDGCYQVPQTDALPTLRHFPSANP